MRVVRNVLLAAMLGAICLTCSAAVPSELPKKLRLHIDFLKKHLSKESTAVIIVDVQGDFTKVGNGSLSVDGSDAKYLEKVELATKILKDHGYKIYATQDWHPRGHVSFASTHDKQAFTGGLWPDHCVQGSKGAEILLPSDLIDVVIQKGTDKAHDSYSGFKDDGGKKTEMDARLKAEGIKNLIIYGIATDYCVKATVRDAIDCGYNVYFLPDLSLGVEEPTITNSEDEMACFGARKI